MTLVPRSRPPRVMPWPVRAGRRSAASGGGPVAVPGQHQTRLYDSAW